MAKVALITGITGQDGAYLAEYLLGKGYVVHGIKRRASQLNTQRIDHLYRDRHESGVRLFLHYGDLTDTANLIRIIQETQPDEIYNLGAMSHVHVSFESALYTADVDGSGIVRILEAVQLLGLTKKTKVYQASSSEIFGNSPAPQNENTPFAPCSPYAAAKLYAYWMTRIYRESKGIFASNGILFNHESPLRGETFVTRKITRAVAQISLGMQQNLFLGNLQAIRDWGHAGDYVRAMWAILQLDKPDDFVIATGRSLTVRQFTQMAFENVGIKLEFKGEGLNEVGQIQDVNEDRFVQQVGRPPAHLKKGQVLVQVLKEYFRPNEVKDLLGDATKAQKILNWEPKYTVEMLAQEMVESDLALFRRQRPSRLREEEQDFHTELIQG